jgi:hypothetical protein
VDQEKNLFLGSLALAKHLMQKETHEMASYGTSLTPPYCHHGIIT